ncbi:MAG TPA: FkbM family methyltransferase [Solirubrobacteraceae bacterium]|nr:FkbM family methyltransferase [Solirubrobacteraceae bacterium]
MPAAEGRAASGLRARLNAIGPVRALLTRPAVEHVVALVNRSSVIARGRARFLARELLGRRDEVLYPVRGFPHPVLVRHGSADVVTLDDVFYSRDYDVPPPVEEVLAAADRPLRVLDLGGNVGYFGAFVLAGYPDAEITSVEADPRNARALRRVVAATGQGNRWKVIEAAASTGEGTARFVQALYSTAHVARAGETSATTEVPAIDVLPLLDGADLVKIDIEGSEWPILADPRFPAAAIRAVALEYHPEGCPEPDARTAAERILREAGYATRPGGHHPAGMGVMWGWRSEPAPTGAPAPPR